MSRDRKDKRRKGIKRSSADPTPQGASASPDESSSSLLTWHRDYVAGLKRAWARMEGKEKMLLPETHLLRTVPVPTPPMLEAALGYTGRLPYVGFYYSPRCGKPVHLDGGDEFPINVAAWNVFVSHPAVLPVLEVHKTFYGTLNGWSPLLSPEEFLALNAATRRGYCSRFHMLVLERTTRRLFIGNWDSANLFLNLAEPDDELHVEENGMLVSRGIELFSESGVPQSVIASLKAWLDDQLGQEDVQCRLAQWHTYHGRPEESLRILDRLRNTASHPSYFQMLGNASMALEDFAGAHAVWERVAKEQPDDCYAQLELAKCSEQLDLYKETIERIAVIENLRESCPPDVFNEGAIVKARTLIKLGRWREAREICESALSEPDELIGPDSDFMAVKAELAVMEGDYAAAAEICEFLMEVGHQDFEECTSERFSLHRPGWWWPTTIRLEIARKNLLALADGSGDINWATATFYFALSRYKEALGYLEDLAPHHSNGIWLHAVTLIACRRVDDAAQLLKVLARNSESEDRWTRFALSGLLHIVRGEFEQALEACEAALHVDATRPEPHAFKGYIYWKAKCSDAAQYEFKRARELGLAVNDTLLRSTESEETMVH